MKSQNQAFDAAQGRAPAHSNAPTSFAPCIRGTATVGDTEFPCDRIDLLSWLDFDDLGGDDTITS